MEPEAIVEIDLRLGPGAENQTELGTKNGVGFVARIDGDITVDVKDEDIERLDKVVTTRGSE